MNVYIHTRAVVKINSPTTTAKAVMDNMIFSQVNQRPFIFRVYATQLQALFLLKK